MTLSNRSLTNWPDDTNPRMSQITIQDRIERFLDKKFRMSRSFSTKISYEAALKQFAAFVYQDYNQKLDLLIDNVLGKIQDPLDVLDDFYTYLTKVKRRNCQKTGFSNRTIIIYISVAKEFLNDVGCKIYSEDLRRKFRLPRGTTPYEEGLTKDQISQILRLANYKLATVILIACSSGMRLAEIVQLRLSDVDFTTSPTTIKIRAETCKTRETRLTHITAEATKALKDFITKNPPKNNDDFIFLSEYSTKLKRLESNSTRNTGLLKKRIEKNLEKMSAEELYYHTVQIEKHNLEGQLQRMISDIPSLNKKSENGRNQVHFHAFRYFFKTQVTDAHQSDFAEALMGHKSLKLVYYRQNAKARMKTYLGIEHALTISDTEKIDSDYSDLQKDNLELRGIVDSLSKQLRNLEKRMDTTTFDRN